MLKKVPPGDSQGWGAGQGRREGCLQAESLPPKAGLGGEASSESVSIFKQQKPL